MMIGFGLLMSFATLVGCKADKNTDEEAAAAADGTADGADGGSCEVTTVTSYPQSGAIDMYYRGTIQVSMDADDLNATLALQDSAGADVAGNFTMEGSDLFFTPSAPLTNSASYTAVLNHCGSSSAVEIPFTVSSLGAPIDDGVDITGQTYAVDLTKGNFVRPALLGTLISTMLENNVLITVTSYNETELNVRGALSAANSTAQDYCSSTLETFPPANFSESPFFEIPKEDVEIIIADFPVTINSMEVSGTFAADGTYFDGGEVKGELDARTIGPVIGDLLGATDPDEICGLLLNLGLSCEECSDDGQKYCLTLEVNQLLAESTGSPLDLVCETNCHVDCGTNECSDPQPTGIETCD